MHREAGKVSSCIPVSSSACCQSLLLSYCLADIRRMQFVSENFSMDLERYTLVGYFSVLSYVVTVADAMPECTHRNLC